MVTAIIDYSIGNLHSAVKAFRRVSREQNAGEVFMTSDPEAVARADRIVLPGDGAFPACRASLFAIDGLHEALHETVVERGRPLLGICIGMQLLATRSHEFTTSSGLDWIGGDVELVRPAEASMKVPHMGWNEMVIDGSHPVLEGLNTGDHAYFVHSYHFRVADDAHRLAYCDYGGDITAIVGRDSMVGTQFHPEKSQASGLRLIANFLTWMP